MENVHGRPDGPVELDLVELSHQLKGLCGIFSMVEDGIPEDGDIRKVFRLGIERMRGIIAIVDNVRKPT